MSTQWYYQSDGYEFGPVSSSELKRAAFEEKIDGNTPVRKGTSAQWVSASHVKGLFAEPDQPTPQSDESLEGFLGSVSAAESKPNALDHPVANEPTQSPAASLIEQLLPHSALVDTATWQKVERIRSKLSDSRYSASGDDLHILEALLVEVREQLRANPSVPDKVFRFLKRAAPYVLTLAATCAAVYPMCLWVWRVESKMNAMADQIGTLRGQTETAIAGGVLSQEMLQFSSKSFLSLIAIDLSRGRYWRGLNPKLQAYIHRIKENKTLTV